MTILTREQNALTGQWLCHCGCGNSTRKENDYRTACRVECKCGCGGRARYAYISGHRPEVECVRCGKKFAALSGQAQMCSQCRRHVRDGRPLIRDARLIEARARQAASPESMRWCQGCEEYLPVGQFNERPDMTKKAGKSKYYARCRACHRVQIYGRAIANKYGLTLELYAAMHAAQQGRCRICGVKADGAVLAIDHDHSCCPADGESCGSCVRGLLCSSCNKGIGFLKDDPEILRRAIEYLED